MRHALHFLLSVLLVSVCMSCNGLFEGIYDEVHEDKTEDNGLTIDPATHTMHVVNLNAVSFESWIYLDLHKGRFTDTISIPNSLTGTWDGRSGIGYKHGLNDWITDIKFIKTDAQTDAQDWDIAIHHFDIKTNGCGAYETEYSSLEELPESSDAFRDVTFTEDEWTEHDVLFDLNGMLNYDVGYQQSMVNKVLSRWVTMDFSTPPPVYTVSGKVYVIRLKDGTYAALKLVNYMKPSGAKGYLTFDVKYPY